MSTQTTPEPGVKTMRLAIEIEVLVDSPDDDLAWLRAQLAGQTGNLKAVGYGFHVTRILPQD